MLFILKAACLAVYALAIVGMTGLLPAGFAHTMRNIAAVMLIVHALELLVVFRHVRLYRGPLAVSMVLTMLFGLLHCKPLVDEHARAQKKEPGP